jgi:ribosomal protein L11 methyltransferase
VSSASGNRVVHMRLNNYSITLKCPHNEAAALSSEIWKLDGILGIEEIPGDGSGLFCPPAEFEILEFGTDAAKRCEDWLQSTTFNNSGKAALKIYVESNDSCFSPSNFLSPIAHAHQATIEIAEKLAPEDYLEKYRKSFQGNILGHQIWVGPPWAKAPSNHTAFYIEPGLAFGTGDHPTTQLCLEWLKAASHQGFNPMRILDLGTGSGILALASKKFFPQATIVVSDLDPQCQEEVKKTFEMNHESLTAVEQYFGSRGTATALQKLPPFDLVISNIYAEVLAKEVPSIRNLVKARGKWVASGILRGAPESVLRLALDGFFTLEQNLSRSGPHNLTESWLLFELSLTAEAPHDTNRS